MGGKYEILIGRYTYIFFLHRDNKILNNTKLFVIRKNDVHLLCDLFVRWILQYQLHATANVSAVGILLMTVTVVRFY